MPQNYSLFKRSSNFPPDEKKQTPLLCFFFSFFVPKCWSKLFFPSMSRGKTREKDNAINVVTDGSEDDNSRTRRLNE